MNAAIAARAPTSAVAAYGASITSVPLTGITNQCRSNNPVAGETTVSFARSEALDAISKLCHTWSAFNGQNDEYAVDGKPYSIHIIVSNCREQSGVDDMVSTDMCSDFLQDAVDNCDTDTVDAKWGNILTVTGDGGYCFNYEIYADTPVNSSPSAAPVAPLTSALPVASTLSV